MKYFLIGCGALVLCAASFALRAPAKTVVKERLVEVPVRVEVPVERIVEVEKGKVVQTEKKAVSRKASAPIAAPLTGDALAQENLLFLFDREVGLSADQRMQMRHVFDERQKKIDAYQDEILQSKILRTREYEDRIRSIQAESYDRMAAVLNADQRRRFHDVVGAGRLGDAVSFEVPEDVIVLE